MSAPFGQSVSFFLSYLAQPLQKAGNETTIYLSGLTTQTGEVISTADFAFAGYGELTIDPLSSTTVESCTFTAVDGAAISLTGATRGLSALNADSSITRMPYHPAGTLVIISFGIQTIQALKAYIDGIAISGSPDASTTTKGIVKMSVAPLLATSPVAVGDNDPRVPTANPDTLYLGVNSFTGIMFPFPGAVVPTGFLLCDGSAVSQGTYANLFAVIGTTYGNPGGGMFNLPDARGLIPVGLKTGDTDFGILGQTGGEKTHTLITAEMPSHNHQWQNSAGGSAGPYFTNFNGGQTPNAFINVPMGNTGGDGAHNNIQPFITLNYIIKY